MSRSLKKTNCTLQVDHSMRMREGPTLPWIIANTEGKVLSAHCTCVAGLGETCCHAAAVLFTIDTANRIQELKTVTDDVPYWGQPSFKEVAYRQGSSIDFTSASSRKHQLDASLIDASCHAPRKRQRILPCIQPSTDEEIKQFFSAIQMNNSGVKPAILSVIAEHADDYVEKSVLLFPPKISDILDGASCAGNYVEILKKCDEIVDSNMLSVTDEQCKNVEIHTRSQANSKLWFDMRAGRITASKLYSVCHTNPLQPAISVITAVCYPKRSKKTTAAMEWGIANEKTARLCYAEKQSSKHVQFKVEESGLHIHPSYPHMAASPDGICVCVCCAGKGCIEIKCPYNARHKPIQEAVAEDKNFPLHWVELEKKLILKAEHPFYTQVQCQMFLSKSDYCDFIIWTEKDIYIERIFPNNSFWDEISGKAMHIFKKAVLPELLCTFFYIRPGQNTV